MNNMISIIIATYNSENDIRMALNSVLSLNYTKWECIVVDGLSKDKTIDIVKEYVSKDTRIKYISERDKGIFDAFNKGFKLASGQWIYYLGSDDTLKKNAFDVNFNIYSNIDILYGNIEILFPNNITKLVKPSRLDKIKYKMIANHQSIIMRKSVIEQLGGFNINYRICADFDLTQRAYLSGFKFEYIDKCISQFSYSGVSSQYSFKNNIDHYRICKRNNSNCFPLFFFVIVELRHFLGFLIKKYIENKI